MKTQPDPATEGAMTAEQLYAFAAFAMMCKAFTECCPYTPTPEAAKLTRAELHRQRLPIPGRAR
jgi:hypothetical protein